MVTMHVGQTASFSKAFSNEDVMHFASLSGDTQPVHLDEEYARRSRFKQRIAHGMLSASVISAALGTKLPGPGTIYLSQSLKFLAPVFVGDTVTATVEVTKVRDDKPIVTLRTECHNQKGEKVIDGEAVVLVEEPLPNLGWQLAVAREET